MLHLCAIASAIHIGFATKDYNRLEFVFHRTKMLQLVNQRIAQHHQVADGLIITVANAAKIEVSFESTRPAFVTKGFFLLHLVLLW